MFESGAIMLYLVDKYDTDRKISYAPGSPEHIEQLGWLMFQMGGVGPMQGTSSSRSNPYIHTQLIHMSDTPQARQTISASSRVPGPTTGSSGTSTRRSVCTRCWSRG